jgi:hypothetical protein
MCELESCQCACKETSRDGTLHLLGLKTMSDFVKEEKENQTPNQTETGDVK